MSGVAPLRAVLSGDSALPRPDFVPDQVPAWLLEGVAALLVVGVVWLGARLAMRLFSRRIMQYVTRPSLGRVALGIIRAGIYILGLLTILRIYGLDLGSIALSVTVFSAVVGVILAPIVGSLISGVFLLADQPYEIGDMVELPDREIRGFVDDITLRYTKLSTLDNTFLVVPNGEMRSRDVVNYSADDTRTRLVLRMLVTYESDIGRARQLMEESARTTDGVITGGPGIRIGRARYPAGPDCLIETFDDSGVQLRLRYWVEEPYRLEKVRSLVQTRVWDALDDDDAVDIAYPHSHLVFDDTSGELQLGGNEPSQRSGSAPRVGDE
jgi:small-conductance mechanosensitive channel